MINLYVYDYLIFVTLIIVNLTLWKLFFKNLFQAFNKKNNWDKNNIKQTNLKKKMYLYIYDIFNIYSIIFLIFLLYFYSYNTNIWFSYIKLNNFSLYIYIVIITTLMYFIYTLKNNTKMFKNYSMEYNISIFNIIITLPIIFLSNNLYILFFNIEVSVLYIFYQFINNKFKNKNKSSINNLYSVFVKNYIYLIFYNFWVSFFSSIFLLYSIILITTISGVIEYHLIQFVISNILNIDYFNNLFILYTSFFLLFNSFFIKLGITPIQLYKLEIYKSISITSIFFYTLVYFLNFFFFFILIFFNYLLNFKLFYINNLIYLIIIGLLFLIIYIYEVNIFKVFLAYSTIINSLFFFIYMTSVII